MRRIVSIVTAVTLATALVPVLAATAEHRPSSDLQVEQVPFDMDSSNQAGWWHPLDVYDGETYFAFDSPAAGAGRHEVYIGQRTGSGEWTANCVKEATGECANYGDDIGHNQPSVALDGNGHIHAFVSMHNDQWRYFRSDESADVTTMVNRSGELPDQEAGVTYPRLARSPAGDVYLMARVNTPGTGHAGHLYRWSVNDQTWDRVAVFTPGHVESGLVPYPDDIQVDDEGNVHILWEWARGSTSNLRYEGSYLVYKPGEGRFLTISGEEIDVPVTPDDEGVVFDAGEGAVRQARFALINGSPHLAGIAYRYRPTPSDNYEVRWASWDGEQWARELVDPGNYETDVAIGATHHGDTARVFYLKSPSCEPEAQRGLFVAEKRVTPAAQDDTWTTRWLGLGTDTGIEKMAAMGAPDGTDVLYLAAPNVGHPTQGPALYFASLDRYPPARHSEAGSRTESPVATSLSESSAASVSLANDRKNWAHRAQVSVSTVLRESSVGECAVDGNYWADWSRWLSSYYEDEPWITATLEEPIQVDEVHVYSGYSPTGDTHINPDFAVDLLIDGEWQEVASVHGNRENPAVLTVEEPAHLEHTDQVRLRVLNMENQNHNARIFELEVYSISDGSPLRTSLAADPPILLFPGDETEVTASLTNRSSERIEGTATLEVPEGWTVTPSDHSYSLDPQETTEATFTVVSPVDASPGTAELALQAPAHDVEDVLNLEVRDGVLLSDDDAPFYTESGTWGASSRPGYDGSGSRYAPIGGGAGNGETATWTPVLSEGGSYRVYVWYPADASRGTTAASYTITHVDGSADVVVNQRENGDSWYPLGTWEFQAGTSGTVTLTALPSATGYHRASAVRFEAIAE